MRKGMSGWVEGGGKSARVRWREKYEEEQWEDKIMMDLGEIKGVGGGRFTCPVPSRTHGVSDEASCHAPPIAGTPWPEFWPSSCSDSFGVLVAIGRASCVLAVFRLDAACLLLKIAIRQRT